MLSLWHLSARLLGLPAQSLLGSPGTLTPGYITGDRVRRDVGDLQSWVRPRFRGNTRTVMIPQNRFQKQKQHIKRSKERSGTVFWVLRDFSMFLFRKEPCKCLKETLVDKRLQWEIYESFSQEQIIRKVELEICRDFLRGNLLKEKSFNSRPQKTILRPTSVAGSVQR